MIPRYIIKLDTSYSSAGNKVLFIVTIVLVRPLFLQVMETCFHPKSSILPTAAGSRSDEQLRTICFRKFIDKIQSPFNFFNLGTVSLGISGADTAVEGILQKEARSLYQSTVHRWNSHLIHLNGKQSSLTTTIATWMKKPFVDVMKALIKFSTTSSMWRHVFSVSVFFQSF